MWGHTAGQAALVWALGIGQDADDCGPAIDRVWGGS